MLALGATSEAGLQWIFMIRDVTALVLSYGEKWQIAIVFTSCRLTGKQSKVTKSCKQSKNKMRNVDAWLCTYQQLSAAHWIFRNTYQVTFKWLLSALEIRTIVLYTISRISRCWLYHCVTCRVCNQRCSCPDSRVCLLGTWHIIEIEGGFFERDFQTIHSIL